MICNKLGRVRTNKITASPPNPLPDQGEGRGRGFPNVEQKNFEKIFGGTIGFQLAVCS